MILRNKIKSDYLKNIIRTLIFFYFACQFNKKIFVKRCETIRL